MSPRSQTPAAGAVTDDRAAYLARVSRDLRHARPPRDEQRVTPVAVLPLGRREIVVEVTSSARYGEAVRLTVKAPTPSTPGAHRNYSDAFLYASDVPALLRALTEALALVVAAAPNRKEYRQALIAAREDAGLPPGEPLAQHLHGTGTVTPSNSSSRPPKESPQ